MFEMWKLSTRDSAEAASRHRELAQPQREPFTSKTTTRKKLSCRIMETGNGGFVVDRSLEIIHLQRVRVGDRQILTARK